ncbi:MAG: hypothetical protein KO206_03300 [Methanomicrobiaceae archaeon]|nr:hypothetical protein [Methanomicrobiaceae archaeon]MDD5418230.1 hypothetical protein [Methanomicrobiaceae archaeon]
MNGRNDYGVSEAIGFILILGIVIGSIGLVTLYGYPLLIKEQTNTDIRNMERTMIVLQNDIKSLCYKNVPYKETSLQVSGGTLSALGAVDGDVSAPRFNITTSTGYDSGEVYLGQLKYASSAGDAVISVSNGAVLKRQEGQQGSVMLAEPRWFYDNITKTFMIYLINLTTNEAMAQTGVGAVRMGLVETETQINESAMTVTVKYNPGTSDDYSTAWRNYLTGSVGMTETAPGSNTYTLGGVDTLVIKEYLIKVHGV